MLTAYSVPKDENGLYSDYYRIVYYMKLKDGKDVEAREALAFGSLYGGLCLGPVNTAAVHALSYPLGGEFHIPHGLSNAILLPSVMKFNAEAYPERYAEVAIALGCQPGKDNHETAQRGVDFIYQLAEAVGIPSNSQTWVSLRRLSTVWRRLQWTCSVC